MARATPKGLHVWDLDSDQFDHLQLADNWDLIDDLLGSPASSIETLASLPTTGNFTGRLVMLSASDGGFPAWTMVRYDGSNWRNAGAIEILPALPTLNNYPGRIVVLSAPVGAFQAWDVVRYDGSAWAWVGGWGAVNTGGGALNMQGVATTGDVYINSTTRGLILVDRASGVKRRFFLDGNNIESEVVT